ncbi:MULTISPECIES: hypothetical protein [unclassified Chryseobacterium]|uniref:hypothetical protein n=1 Tax=unclassified Chryseobacterium TaxID=2593645 RepID=UPI00226A5F79|nr:MULTISPECIES: hypothetical protein [unclassified Chryseobacterium]
MKIPIIFYLLFFTFFSCKKAPSRENEKKVIETKSVKKNSSVDTWKFVKIFSLSPSSNYSCEYKKYENVEFGLSKDSIFINGKYTDDVYTNSITSTSYFDQQYLYRAYKKRLKEELNLDFPLKVKSIRNKKAYDNSSLLNQYFEDAFFIGDYMIFDDNGCIVCFKKANTKEIGKVIKVLSKKDFESFPEINKTIIIDDSQATAVYEINDNIFVAWFDGDNEKWYLVTYKNKNLVSELLIGKSETIENENGTLDNYIDFKIDENLKISLEFSTGQNKNSKKIIKTENYQINTESNKIEKL